MSVALVALEHIEITPGVCGGKPHIAGHRVSVQNVAIWHERMGLEPDEIATTYGLTLGEVYAALAYYHDNRSEVDESVASDESFVTELRRKMPAKLAEKLRGSSD